MCAEQLQVFEGFSLSCGCLEMNPKIHNSLNTPQRLPLNKLVQCKFTSLYFENYCRKTNAKITQVTEARKSVTKMLKHRHNRANQSFVKSCSAIKSRVYRIFIDQHDF